MYKSLNQILAGDMVISSAGVLLSDPTAIMSASVSMPRTAVGDNRLMHESMLLYMSGAVSLCSVN